MSTPQSRPTGAAALPPVIRPGAERRRHPHSAIALQRLSSRLDILIRDAELGARSQREVDRMIGEGEAIADGIRDVVRGPSAQAQVNPPLFLEQRGETSRAAW